MDRVAWVLTQHDWCLGKKKRDAGRTPVTKQSRAMSLQVKCQPEEWGQTLPREPEVAQPCCAWMLGLQPPELCRIALRQGVVPCYSRCRSLMPSSPPVDAVYPVLPAPGGNGADEPLFSASEELISVTTGHISGPRERGTGGRSVAPSGPSSASQFGPSLACEHVLRVLRERLPGVGESTAQSPAGSFSGTSPTLCRTQNPPLYSRRSPRGGWIFDATRHILLKSSALQCTLRSFFKVHSKDSALELSLS